MFCAVRWFPVLICASAIFWLSSQSDPPGADLAPDYIGHFLVYAALAATSVWGWTDRFKNQFTCGGLLAVVAMATAYGAGDEFHQSFVPFREMSGRDLLVDFLGASTAAWGLYRLLNRNRTR